MCTQMVLLYLEISHFILFSESFFSFADLLLLSLYFHSAMASVGKEMSSKKKHMLIMSIMYFPK